MGGGDILMRCYFPGRCQKKIIRTFYKKSEFDSPRSSHQRSSVGNRPERSSGNSASGLKYLNTSFAGCSLLISPRSPSWLSTVKNAASVGWRSRSPPLSRTRINSCAKLVYNKWGSDRDAEMKDLPFPSQKRPSIVLCRQSPES